MFCLEIFFNLMLSNNGRIVVHLNSTMCNFYETLIKLLNTTFEDSGKFNAFKAMMKNIIYMYDI